jgi:iron(III) transport system substrate-binding protein
MLAAALGGAALAAGPSLAETMTPATTKMLETAKLSPEVLAGLDQELAVPAAWVEGARQEGELKLRMTIDPRLFEDMGKVFETRYPFVKIEYTRGITRGRAMAPLIAVKEGKRVADVITDFDTLKDEFYKEKAFIDLTGLPTYANVPDFAREPGGVAVGLRLTYWCTAYNTRRVKKEELPKTWDDVLEGRRWRNGAVGAANYPQQWIAYLAPIWGQEKTTRFMTRFFAEVKPQLRKESLGAIVKLVGLGEFDLAIPAADRITKREAEEGGPIGYHCPEPVPLDWSLLGILSGGPNPNAAKLYVNWLLSKEGQIAMHTYAHNIPIHKDLPQRSFLIYPDEIIGKKLAPGGAESEAVTPAVMSAWQGMWVKAGGAKADSR